MIPTQEEVIEAGMEGALSEAMVERALVLHDNLVKALERERSMARPAAQAAELGQGQEGGSTDDLIDLGGEDSKAASASPAAAPPQGLLLPSSSSAAAAASFAGLPPSDDAFAIFGPPVTSSGGQMQQQAQGPLTTTGTAGGASTDRAVLAEADELLQQLSLGRPSEVEQQQQEGKG